MKRIIVFTSVLLAAFVLVGCGGKKKAAMPAELPALAAEFKGMAGGEAKIELGKKIRSLLPTCTRQEPGSNMATIDYDNPTYVLKVPELHALLGAPAESDPNGEYYSYDLGKGEKTTFYLLVEIYDDYVSSARIDVGK